MKLLNRLKRGLNYVLNMVPRAYSSSPYYILNTLDVTTFCQLSPIDLKDFRYFTHALVKVCTLNLTAGSYSKSAAKIFLLYNCVHYLLQSEVVDSISNRNKTISVSSFIAAALINLATRVRSRNKVAGFTAGEMYGSSL